MAAVRAILVALLVTVLGTSPTLAQGLEAIAGTAPGYTAVGASPLLDHDDDDDDDDDDGIHGLSNQERWREGANDEDEDDRPLSNTDRHNEGDRKDDD